jgi:hypothetical protein
VSGSSGTSPSPTATSPPTASTDIITTTVQNAYTTAVYTGPATGLSLWIQSQVIKAKHREKYANAIGSTQQKQKRQQPARYLDMPFVVKIEERRLAESPQPYCQQYQILDNGHANIAIGGDGGPIIVHLEEQDPVQTADAATTGVVPARKIKRGGLAPNSCHCQWMSGEDYDYDNDGD